MTIYLKLAWRNIWRNRRRTLITVSAIIFAVVFAIFGQSLNRGSHEIMIDNMTRFNTGYLQLQDRRFNIEPSLDNSFAYDAQIDARINRAHSHIDLILPRIETFMLAADEEATRGAIVMGIEPEKEQLFNNLEQRLQRGRFFTTGETAAVIGQGLAERLRLDIGDTLALIGQGRFGMSASGLFTVVGIIDHPLREMNDRIVYLSLTAAQELLAAEGYITNLLLVPEHPRDTDRIATALRDEFAGNDLRVLTWPELMPELLQLLRFDMAGSYLMSAILYVVIGFGFFGTVLTMTLERLKEFGILLSVGMQRKRLAIVVFLETLWISLLGVICGLAAAWLVLLYFHLNPIELTGNMAQTVIDMGWDPILPVSFAPELFYTQGIIVFVLAMLVFIYPLLKIVRLNVLAAARS
jgi:putative ABC transport system permease protein